MFKMNKMSQKRQKEDEEDIEKEISLILNENSKPIDDTLDSQINQNRMYKDL